TPSPPFRGRRRWVRRVIAERRTALCPLEGGSGGVRGANGGKGGRRQVALAAALLPPTALPREAVLRAGAEVHEQRCAGEGIGGADLVLQKALVGEVHELRVVDVEHELGRCHGDLAGVADLELAPA